MGIHARHVARMAGARQSRGPLGGALRAGLPRIRAGRADDRALPALRGRGTPQPGRCRARVGGPERRRAAGRGRGQLAARLRADLPRQRTARARRGRVPLQLLGREVPAVRRLPAGRAGHRPCGRRRDLQFAHGAGGRFVLRRRAGYAGHDRKLPAASQSQPAPEPRGDRGGAAPDAGRREDRVAAGQPGRSGDERARGRHRVVRRAGADAVPDRSARAGRLFPRDARKTAVRWNSRPMRRGAVSSCSTCRRRSSANASAPSATAIVTRTTSW